MDTNQYKDLFLSEAREILGILNKSLVNLEKNSGDRECLNEIFRQAHTFKGMAATMGYDEITQLTHAMENVLDLLRQGKFRADKNIVAVLFDAFDALEILTNAVSSGQADGNGRHDVAILAARLETIVAGHKDETAQIQTEKPPALLMAGFDRSADAARETHGLNTCQVDVVIARESEFKRPRALVVVRALQDIGRVLHPESLNQELAANDFDGRFECLLVTNEQPDLISVQIKAIQDVENVSVKPVKLGGAPLPGEKGAPTSVTLGKAAPNESHGTRPEAQTIRVPLNKLDKLMDAIGEMATSKLRLRNIAGELNHQPLDEALDRMGRLVNDLQADIIDVRLVPMSYIFNRFPRLVRDLAARERKEVDFAVEGGNIGLDRTILDEINTPLVHLLKNAVTHGIELPEARKKEGKPPIGKVTLSARREKAFVIIELSDDGRGMDAELIRKAAIQKGLISGEQAAELSAEDAMMLITLPGFSTSAAISEAAGRGVGMNAVRTTVESFGGFLTIESKPHQSSRFFMKLPISMSIVQALLVGVANESYAIPLVNIVEVAKIMPDMIRTMEHREFINYHDEVLPLIRLGERYGFTSGNNPGAGQTGCVGPVCLAVVVVEMGRKKAGLVVDRFPEKQEIVIKTLTEPLKHMRGIAGATVLADGKVALIVDINALL